MFKLSASDFQTMGMHRRKRGFADKFLAVVTEGVVHGVHKVVTRSPFGVIWQHRPSGGKRPFRHSVTRSQMNLVR